MCSVSWKLAAEPMNPLVAPDLSRTALSVNLNKVALLRNTRHLGLPSVTRAAVLVLEAGAQGITVHPRPDERHIRSHDVHELHALLQQFWPQIEFNIEGNPLHNLMDFVRALKPHQATFVPDGRDQATSDHGWFAGDQGPADLERLAPLIAETRALGVRVSLFMDPDPTAMRLAREAGADRVELYTESYARAHGTPQQAEVLARFTAAAQAARAVGLGVNAGHDLNRANLADFLRAVPGVSEVSIGHALIADALELGYTETVRDYQRCIQRAYAAPETPAASSPQGGASASGRPVGRP
jgi:pyridoxine 5-phosphate synthase